MPLDRLYDAAAFDPDRPPESWWRASAPPTRHAFAPLGESAECDVAIVGAGFTGLNAALKLARDHGADVRVLDAGDPGFGASGRNAGFCCIPAAKSPWETLIRGFGREETGAFLRAQLDAIDHVRATLDALGEPADRTSEGGELELAHHPRELESLRAEAALLRDNFGVKTEVFEAAELRQIGAAGAGFHGAIRRPWGFGLHPMKYVRALADAAADAGASIHARTEVTRIDLKEGAHRLVTASGAEVRAKRLILATNGYTAEGVPEWIGGRLLPVISAMMVTRPLTEAELAAQGFTTDHMSFDSRNLFHYFRRLPDNRFLFGARGAIETSPDAVARWNRRLRADFDRIFPKWAGVETTHNWSGFACVNRRLAPHIGRIDGLETAWTALAFHGNGVATGSWSGAKLADLVTGAMREAELPAILSQPLDRFPVPPLRKAYLRAVYAWRALKDVA